MSFRNKRRALQGVVGGAGVVAALGGVLGIYSLAVGIFAAFAIWIIGATLVIAFTDS